MADEQEKVDQENEPEAPSEAPAPTEEPQAEPEPVSHPAPPLAEGQHYVWGTGRRKKATARVRIRPGSGQILINKRDLEKYFSQDRDRQAIIGVLQTVEMPRSWDIWVKAVSLMSEIVSSPASSLWRPTAFSYPFLVSEAS